MQPFDGTREEAVREFARLPRKDRDAISRHLKPIERMFLAELLNEKSRNTNRLIALKIEMRLAGVSPRIRHRIRNLLLRGNSKCPPGTQAQLSRILGLSKNGSHGATTLAAQHLGDAGAKEGR